ncbi:MAG: hypothetical protein ACO1OB_26390 [Archangium sp.]
MFRLVIAAVSCSAAVAFADPEVVVDCPAGMHFVENKGCVANIAPKCPGGTKFENGKCVAIVDTSCPAGMHFVGGTGCVANSAKAVAKTTTPPPPPPPAAEAEPAPAKGKKGGTFSGNIFSDRLQATCASLHFEVQGAPRLTGVRAQLLVDGMRLSDEQLLDIGDIKHIEGVVKGKRVDLKIQQAVFGTRYTLNVDGEECRLGK